MVTSSNKYSKKVKKQEFAVIQRFFFFFLLIFFCQGNQALAQFLSAKKLLEFNSKAHSYCINIKMDVEGVFFQNVGKSTKQKRAFTFWRKGDSLSVKGSFTFIDWPDGGPEPVFFHNICDENGWLTATYKPITKGPIVAGTSAKKRSNIIDDPSNGCILDGYFPWLGGFTIGDIIKKSSDLFLHKAVVMVDGDSCFLLKGTTKWGKASLWISKEKGFLMKKAILIKGLKDILYGDMTLEDSNIKYGTKYTDNCTLGIKNVVFEKKEDIWLPTEGEFFFSCSGESNPHNSKVYFKRYNIILNPKFGVEEPFHLKLTDNFPITNEDDRDSGVFYVWKSGKVIPKSSDYQTQAEFFLNQRSFFLLFAMVLVGLILFFLGLKYILKHKEK